MDTFLIYILLYPYPYQYEAAIITLLIIAIFGSVAYGIYRLIICMMNVNIKAVFHRFLKIAGILIVVLFFAEMTVSLITIYHVNKQLGFRYATPDTPEGELFEIQKVVPGRTMDQAGLKPLDQVQMNKVNNLYRLLINNQGKEVDIPILRNKEKIKIRVSVPELDVPLAAVSFLF